MIVKSKIIADLTRPNFGGARVNAVQGDGNTRCAEITLQDGGKPWTPPEGVDVAVAYYQPCGTKGLYNKLADGTAAISISGNVATVILASQMLTVSGTVQATLVFNDAQLNRLTTFPFAVSVTPNPAAGAQKTEDYIRLQWLEDKLTEYLAEIKASGAFDGKPGDPGRDYDHSPEFTALAAEMAGYQQQVSEDRQQIADAADAVDASAKAAAGSAGIAAGAQQAAEGAATAAAKSAEDAERYAEESNLAVDSLRPVISQIKNDLANKLQKSPADWQEWTSEEQAAARERMGIPGDYELIEEITVTEDLQKIERSYDLDGNMYAFRSILLISKFPKPAEGRSQITNFLVFAKLNNGKSLSSFTTYYLNEYENTTYQLIQNQNGLYNMVFSECTSNKGYLSAYPARISSSFGLGDYIKSIQIETTLSVNIYSGTVIKIYGVRA